MLPGTRWARSGSWRLRRAHRDYAEAELAGLLDHDLDDVRRIARLGPDRAIRRR
jgi:hypothetical protein